VVKNLNEHQTKAGQKHKGEEFDKYEGPLQEKATRRINPSVIQGWAMARGMGTES